MVNKNLDSTLHQSNNRNFSSGFFYFDWYFSIGIWDKSRILVRGSHSPSCDLPCWKSHTWRCMSLCCWFQSSQEFAVSYAWSQIDMNHTWQDWVKRFEARFVDMSRIGALLLHSSWVDSDPRYQNILLSFCHKSIRDSIRYGRRETWGERKTLAREINSSPSLL